MKTDFRKLNLQETTHGAVPPSCPVARGPQVVLPSRNVKLLDMSHSDLIDPRESHLWPSTDCRPLRKANGVAVPWELRPNLPIVSNPKSDRCFGLCTYSPFSGNTVYGAVKWLGLHYIYLSKFSAGAIFCNKCCLNLSFPSNRHRVQVCLTN